MGKDRAGSDADSLGKHVLAGHVDTGSGSPGVGELSPGKQTLTQALGYPRAAPVQAKTSGDAGDSGDVHAAAAAGTSGPGGALPHLDQIQRSFGRHDVSGIHAHQDDRAADGARAMGATAFATGNHVAFAGAPSLHTAAHEAAHIVQQRAGVHLSGGVGQAGDAYERHADQVADLVVKGESSEALLGHGGGGGAGGAVQRYEAGEHAKTGDTQDELKKAYAPIQYTVVKGDTLESIAAKFKVTIEELKAANPDKLKKHPGAGGKQEDGFDAGDHISVPQKLNDMAKDAVKDPSIKVTVNGVVFDYGTLIAMGGDFFGSDSELASAPPDQLKELAALIEEEKKTGKLIDTPRWIKATRGKYLDLAAKNEAHFAPSNPDFAAVSGKSSADHKGSWESQHRKAIGASRAGEKDKALMQNAFGDHFLTDAFSSGHLFNKRDVMEKFDSQLPTQGTGEKRKFTDPSKGFFNTVATLAFVGDVATEFSKYETAEAWALGWHPNINSADRFSSLLQGIHLEKPELLESAVAKGVHDKLNTTPGGVPVENVVGDKWPLSGDGTLNSETLAIARRAVAQSQQNVIASFKAPSDPDFAALFKKVWDFTPRPTAEGKKVVTGAVTTGSDVHSHDLHMAIVDLIKANYLTIIAELVKLNKLKKA